MRAGSTSDLCKSLENPQYDPGSYDLASPKLITGFLGSLGQSALNLCVRFHTLFLRYCGLADPSEVYHSRSRLPSHPSHPPATPFITVPLPFSYLRRPMGRHYINPHRRVSYPDHSSDRAPGYGRLFRNSRAQAQGVPTRSCTGGTKASHRCSNRG